MNELIRKFAKLQVLFLEVCKQLILRDFIVTDSERFCVTVS